VSRPVTPRALPCVPTGAIKDTETRRALQALSTAWQTRNGQTGARFTTGAELSEVSVTRLADMLLALQAELLALQDRVRALEARR